MFDGRSLNFLFDEKVSDILHQLQINDVEGRLVGGCVRDAVVGKKVSDIDIAVNASPTRILEIFSNREKYKAIPTGIDHGTVTVVLKNQPFELTSLRKDVETDGRHALVSYTTNWEEDAARRDFTMNALYVSKSLEIFDYFGGVYDLTNGVIRFIGNPKDRINEDHLRILRYYRFFMNYGRVIDEPSEVAVREAVLFLRNLSKERVQSELFKLLSVTDLESLPVTHSVENFGEANVDKLADSNKLVHVLQKMSNHGVFYTLFKKDAELNLLQKLLAISPIDAEGTKGVTEILRLFCMFPIPVDFLKGNLVLSNKQRKLLSSLYKHKEEGMSEENLFKIRYFCGDDLARLWLAFQQAKSLEEDAECAKTYETLLQKFEEEIPPFPVRGTDLLNQGMSGGAILGEKLKACETWWLSKLGECSREECINFCLNLA